MHYFAPQLRAEQQSTRSLRATQYRKKRKTSHDHEQDEDEHSSSSRSDVDVKSRSVPSNSYPHPSFASSELAQLRLAGLLPEEEYRVPPSPFPHAPASLSKPYLGTTKIQKELAEPPLRLFTVNSATSRGDHGSSQTEAHKLRRTHLNVLSTVMHRCLLQGDYDRAGRAWGMILRTQATGGHAVDMRNHGRWGIGAEILLRRSPQVASTSTQNQQDGASNIDPAIFSEEGFELAREYYERLIVQYPTRKQAPHTIDQRSFYPAMFSLWIQEVCEKSRRARRRHENEAQQSRSRSRSIDSSDGKDVDHARSHEDAIRVEELARAMEIAERLDDLVKSPPFDKLASLLQLRGNTALWISDLIVANTSASPMDEWDVYPIRTGLSSAEQITKFTNCQRELLVAQNYLARVEENGGMRQVQTLGKIESRVKELRKQIATLQSGVEEDSNVEMEEDW